MKNKFVSKDYKRLIIYGLILVLVAMSVGFAALSTNLSINGSATAKSNSWDVHFENLKLSDSNTVTGTQSVSDDTALSFDVILSKPGDSYNMTIDVVNKGTIDAMVSTISKTELSEEQAKYLDLKITYKDNNEISKNDKLVASSGRETINISLSYKDDVDASDLPATDTPVTVNFSINYVQADNNAVERVQGISFASDSWETISEAVSSGNYAYKVGDTRIVTVAAHTDDCGLYGGTGADYQCYSYEIPEQELTVRVANISECINGETSETACGFVVEFADIIDTHEFNEDTEDYVYGYNLGGWPASKLRTYINDTIYNALPGDLQNVIIDTTVVSSHGSTEGETNFTSTDKLYLLSMEELFSTFGGYQDSSLNTSRTLDYYKNLDESDSTYIKTLKTTNTDIDSSSYHNYWWLRSSNLVNDSGVFIIKDNGKSGIYVAGCTFGVSPAFRIA